MGDVSDRGRRGKKNDRVRSALPGHPEEDWEHVAKALETLVEEDVLGLEVAMDHASLATRNRRVQIQQRLDRLPRA